LGFADCIARVAFIITPMMRPAPATRPSVGISLRDTVITIHIAMFLRAFTALFSEAYSTFPGEHPVILGTLTDGSLRIVIEGRHLPLFFTRSPVIQFMIAICPATAGLGVTLSVFLHAVFSSRHTTFAFHLNIGRIEALRAAMETCVAATAAADSARFTDPAIVDGCYQCFFSPMERMQLRCDITSQAVRRVRRQISPVSFSPPVSQLPLSTLSPTNNHRIFFKRPTWLSLT
jgi:hypothetical protein